MFFLCACSVALRVSAVAICSDWFTTEIQSSTEILKTEESHGEVINPLNR